MSAKYQFGKEKQDVVQHVKGWHFTDVDLRLGS